jgi:hypothetical protein
MNWEPGKPSADQAIGLGGEPLVQPGGTVIVPFSGIGVQAFTSTDGGNTWGKSVLVSSPNIHLDAGGIRNPYLPTAAIDGAGTAYVAWADCRFRTACGSKRHRLQHVDQRHHMGEAGSDSDRRYHQYRRPFLARNRNRPQYLRSHRPHFCGLLLLPGFQLWELLSARCRLHDLRGRGATWTSGTQLAGPMKLTWLPLSDNGYMVADYIMVSYNNGNPFGVFAVAVE